MLPTDKKFCREQGKQNFSEFFIVISPDFAVNVSRKPESISAEVFRMRDTA